MSRTQHHGKNRRAQRERNIRVRGVHRSTPDMHRLARVLIAIAQAEAEATAEAEHRKIQESSAAADIDRPADADEEAA